MRNIRKTVVALVLLSLGGCAGPTHFQSRTGRVLETLTAVGAATAGAAASHSQNEYLPPPPLVP